MGCGCNKTQEGHKSNNIDIGHDRIKLVYALESQSSRAFKSILDAGRLVYFQTRVDTFKGEHMKDEILFLIRMAPFHSFI